MFNSYRMLLLALKKVQLVKIIPCQISTTIEKSPSLRQVPTPYPPHPHPQLFGMNIYWEQSERIERTSPDRLKESMLCYGHRLGYQHSADIFVKNIFNPFHGPGLFLYFLKYIRKLEVS